MRFGKKLALAMIRDAGEAPYLSQKELKHTLVGLEKLCKAYLDQQQMLLDGVEVVEAERFAKDQRVAYNVALIDGLLSIEEVISKDADFFTLLSSNVVDIRRYIESCEASLMEAINEWLYAAESANVVLGPKVASLGNDPEILSRFVIEVSNPEALPEDSIPDDIIAEFDRLKAYGDVNISAIRKLLQRRNKNVLECFWSKDDFTELSEIRTPEFSHLEQTITAIKTLSNRS